MLSTRLRSIQLTVYNPEGPAFLALNDEIAETAPRAGVEKIDQAVHDFMESIWPEEVRPKILESLFVESTDRCL